LANLFCSVSILLASYTTRARRECKAHASRTHYLFKNGMLPTVVAILQAATLCYVYNQRDPLKFRAVRATAPTLATHY